MGLGKLTGAGITIDAAIHLLVSAAIFGLTCDTYLKADYSSETANYAAILLTASLLQALYHFGLLLRTSCAKKKITEELGAGATLRNVLTGVGLVSSWALLGKVGNDTMVILAVALFCLMRFLDTIMNGSYKNYKEIGDLWKHSCKEDEANLMANGEGVVLFTPRLVITHFLLLLAAITSSVDISPDEGYLKPVAGEYYTIALISALILQWLHFFLYPLSLLTNCSCGEGECKDDSGTLIRKEFISVNRIPIIRTVVAAAVLSCLSFSYGKLTPAQPTRLLLINLGLYFAADQIGFDVC